VPFGRPGSLLSGSRVAGPAGGIPNFLAAVAAVRAGTGNARIIFAGDSTTRGYNAVIPGADIFAQAYPTVLAPLLEAATALDCRADQAFVGSGNMGPYAWGDGRISTTMTHLTGGVGGFFRATAAGSITLTPGYSWDSVDIYYVRTTTIGFTYQIGAGAPVAPVVSGLPQPVPAKITVTKPAGSETLTLAWTAGDFRLAGVHFYNAADRLVQFFNAGVAGAQISNITTSTAGTGGLSWIPFWDGDLVIMDFGINDFFVSKPIATFKSEFQTAINAFRAAGCDVILKTPVPTSIAGTPPQTDYIQAVRDLATVNRAPLIDGYAAWGSWAAANALGYFSDATHPSALGYANIASLVVAVLAALIPPAPSGGAFLLEAGGDLLLEDGTPLLLE
jgi:lysophospholipase L1-like esterase